MLQNKTKKVSLREAFTESLPKNDNSVPGYLTGGGNE
jgi:hypothetical protein